MYRHRLILIGRTAIKSKLLTIMAFVMIVTINYSLFGNENKGTTGFNFLRVPYSARAAALANSYTGLSDDVNAVFFNPAGLVQLSKRSFSTTYINYFEGFHGGSAVFSFPIEDHTQIALFTQYLGSGSITRTEVDEYGEYMGTRGTFGANNIIFGISGGRYIHEMLNIGLTGKLIREQLDDYSATAVAADISLMHQTTNDQLIIGVTLQNIGTQLTYHTSDNYEESIPSGVAIGFRYFPHENLTGLLDIRKPFDNDFGVGAGIEYSIHPTLDLRAGYNAQGSDWQAGGDFDLLSGFSTGIGLHRGDYVFDYAVSSYGDLGIINQVSLSYLF